MKVIVIGAGAIGGVTAAYMAMSGIDVTLVCKRQSVLDAICLHGVHIVGKRGEHWINVKTVLNVSDIENPKEPSKFDYCLIATKAYDLQAAAENVLPYLKDDGLVIAMQNGICIDALTEAVGSHRAAQAVVTWSCTMRDDAFFEITGEGGFVLGRADGTIDSKLEELKRAMDKMAPTKITSRILNDMYSKLIINSGITCGGAMTGQTLGQMLGSEKTRRFFIALAKEDMALARAMNLEVPPFGGQLDYYRFIKGEGFFPDLRRNMILFIVGIKYRNLKSSSLTSLQRGGKTEVDTLNGWISKKAYELHVSTPVNDRVVKIIHEIENGQRTICPENLLETF